MIPYGRQDIDEADIEAIVAALRSDFLTQGPAVPRFEQAVAALCGARHVVAANSGTSSLHLACMALGLGPGDTLWTVPITYVASANCARYCGANVDFVDIDPETWNISVPMLRDKLARARRAGTLPKVVVPVHFAGQPSDQEEIWALADEFQFKVLEDASHSIGASRNGEPVGSCKWSHVCVFSFHPVKVITTGEGGAGLTNDPELAWRMSLLRTHGVTREPARMSGEPQGAWHYEQLELGYNYRMTDLHAALGTSQLRRLKAFVERRNALAAMYNEKLSMLPLQLPSVSPGNLCSFHLYVVRVRAGRHRRREVFDFMRGRDIGVNVHYTPVHLQPYYRALGFKPGMFPESERFGNEAITLPLFPALTSKDFNRVVSTVADAFQVKGGVAT